MSTRFLMLSVTVVLFIFGLLFSFTPEEILKFYEITPQPALILMLQLLGALYLGFAMLNWLARNSQIGGIYNRPIVFANFLHFLVGCIAIAKHSISYEGHLLIIMLFVCTIYFIYTLLFGYLLKNQGKLSD